MRCLAGPAAQRRLGRREGRQRRLAVQELDFDPEILILFEGVPVLEIQIGATSVAQAENEARRTRVKVAEGPEAFDTLDVAPGEAVDFAIEDMQHVAEFV